MPLIGVSMQSPRTCTPSQQILISTTWQSGLSEPIKHNGCRGASLEKERGNLTAVDSVVKVDLSSAPMMSRKTSNLDDRAGSCGSTEVPSPSIPGRYNKTIFSGSLLALLSGPPAIGEEDGPSPASFHRSNLTPRMSIASGRLPPWSRWRG